MTRKELEALGLEKDVIDKIMAMHGKGIESFKNDVAKKDEEIKALEKQVSDSEKLIKELEKDGTELEDVKAEVDKYKEKLQEAKEAKDVLEFNHALEQEIAEYKPYDVKDIISYIDKDDLVFKDGKFVNLEEIMKDVQESKSYWFPPKEDETKPKFSTGGSGEPSVEMSQEESNHLDYFGRVELKRTDEETYKKLMGGM